MNVTLVIVLGMLVLSILAPFISLYAVSFITKKDYANHIKIQKSIFWVCVVGVLILELQIRLSGGSGSLVINSKYANSTFFNFILIAHIIGAVVTYVIWAITIFWSGNKFRKKRTLPGGSSKTNKRLGYISIIGLFYTAVTASIVCIMAFFI